MSSPAARPRPSGLRRGGRKPRLRRLAGGCRGASSAGSDGSCARGGGERAAAPCGPLPGAGARAWALASDRRPSARAAFGGPGPPGARPLEVSLTPRSVREGELAERGKTRQIRGGVPNAGRPRAARGGSAAPGGEWKPRLAASGNGLLGEGGEPPHPCFLFSARPRPHPPLCPPHPLLYFPFFSSSSSNSPKPFGERALIRSAVLHVNKGSGRATRSCDELDFVDRGGHNTGVGIIGKGASQVYRPKLSFTGRVAVDTRVGFSPLL